jgi:hypothetical protein
MTVPSNPTNWTPPDGLGYSSARPVQLAAGGWVLAVLGVLFLIGGPLLAWFVSGQIQREKERNRLLAEQGVETTATIVRVWRESNKEGDHMVSYRFSADGSEITGRSKMYRNVWADLHAGDPLPIRYVPARPDVNHPAQPTPGPAPDWVPWMVGGFFMWPPFLFWWMVRRQAALLEEGRPTPATVTQIRRAKQVIAYYEFKLLDGSVVKGRSQVNRRSIPQIGQQATVLYLPDNPRRNGLYPLELVKLQK